MADRLGEKRLADLRWRCDALALMAEHIRAAEEVHLVPADRGSPSSGLATAVVSWARGASFETALGVAARDVGDVAPGDFVRTMKSVADLVQQVAHVATVPATQRRRPGRRSGSSCEASWPPAFPSPNADGPSAIGPFLNRRVGRPCSRTSKRSSPPTRRPSSAAT